MLYLNLFLLSLPIVAVVVIGCKLSKEPVLRNQASDRCFHD